MAIDTKIVAVIRNLLAYKTLNLPKMERRSLTNKGKFLKLTNVTNIKIPMTNLIYSRCKRPKKNVKKERRPIPRENENRILSMGLKTPSLFM